LRSRSYVLLTNNFHRHREWHGVLMGRYTLALLTGCVYGSSTRECHFFARSADKLFRTFEVVIGRWRSLTKPTVYLARPLFRCFRHLCTPLLAPRFRPSLRLVSLVYLLIRLVSVYCPPPPCHRRRYYVIWRCVNARSQRTNHFRPELKTFNCRILYGHHATNIHTYHY